MSLIPGLPVEIFKGKNIGMTGIFHSYVPVVSCKVTLDGNQEPQLFRRGSVRAIIVMPPVPRAVVNPVPRVAAGVTTCSKLVTQTYYHRRFLSLPDSNKRFRT